MVSIHWFLWNSLVNVFMVCVCRMVIYISLINYVVQAVPQSHIDNEYANATEKDAKIFLTISRDLSAPLTGFVKVRISSLVLVHLYCIDINIIVKFHINFTMFRIVICACCWLIGLLTLCVESFCRSWRMYFLTPEEWIVVVRYVPFLCLVYFTIL